MDLRREFDLSQDDIEYLNAKGYEWETTRSNGFNWLIIHHFPIPPGYNALEATIAINVTAYAPGRLDMVYIYPALSRLDSKPINCTQCVQNIHGLPFQRWSRHYTWNSDTCNLVTHLAHVEEWLIREFTLR